jgi:hypothetical protein
LSSVINMLREDPLSTGILGMIFLKISDHSSLCKTEVKYLKLPKFSTGSTQMIYNEVGNSIPYIGIRSELSSSHKRLISEAGLYNIGPNIHFYCKSARCFNIFLFWIDGCLLRRESLHTQSFSDILTVQPMHTLYGR